MRDTLTRAVRGSVSAGNLPHRSYSLASSTSTVTISPDIETFKTFVDKKVSVYFWGISPCAACGSVAVDIINDNIKLAANFFCKFRL